MSLTEQIQADFEAIRSEGVWECHRIYMRTRDAIMSQDPTEILGLCTHEFVRGFLIGKGYDVFSPEVLLVIIDAAKPILSEWIQEAYPDGPPFAQECPTSPETE